MRLKELRLQRKYKQIEIADVLNCSQGVYSRYESAEREPPFDIIVKLADFYGVSVDYLMGRGDNEQPAPSPAPKVDIMVRSDIPNYLEKLNPKNRALLEEMARKLFELQQQEEKNKPPRGDS